MNDEQKPAGYHENLPQFRNALASTAAATGFRELLIEKDYYCSVLLKDLEALFQQGLVFKGGTCLSKVHSDFFRLSEDLDFALSVKADATRGERREIVKPIKAHITGVTNRHPVFADKTALTGNNDNKQHNGEVAYRSVITGDYDFIKIEVSLREEVLLPSELIDAKTLLRDPQTNSPAVAPFAVRALSLAEAYAEKFRAALTRRSPAIRDFFDIDNAICNGLLQPDAPEFLNLVSQKLAATDDSIDVSNERIDNLVRQIEPQLKPVLRATDYDRFVLNRVVDHIRKVVAWCEKPRR